MNVHIQKKLRQQFRELNIPKKAALQLLGAQERVELATALCKDLHIAIAQGGTPVTLLSASEYSHSALYTLMNNQELPAPSLFGLLSDQELQQLAAAYNIKINLKHTPIDKHLTNLEKKYSGVIPATQRSLSTIAKLKDSKR